MDDREGWIMVYQNSNSGGAEANAPRPLHMFWLWDTSGSMAMDNKMLSLNNAVRELMPELCDFQASKPGIEIKVRSISFSNGARWDIPRATPVKELEWANLVPGQLTDMGQAFELLFEALNSTDPYEFIYAPVFILATDGQPTDKWKNALNRLNAHPLGRAAIKVGIGIGKNAGLDVLQRFVGTGEGVLLSARNSGALELMLLEAMLAALTSASLLELPGYKLEEAAKFGRQAQLFQDAAFPWKG